MKKTALIFCALLAFTACNEYEEHIIEEDYDALFPFEGIDEYEDADGDIVVRNEDPDITKKTFVYKGEDKGFDPTVYEVVVRYRYENKNARPDHSARYVVRFVNEKQELVSISSNPATGYMDAEEYEELNGKPGQGYEMEYGKDYEIKYQVESGHQLLLCVNGYGPRNTAMIASITATPLDGTTEPVVLQTEQYQNKEGQVSLPYPYCKYVVLP